VRADCSPSFTSGWNVRFGLSVHVTCSLVRELHGQWLKKKQVALALTLSPTLGWCREEMFSCVF
jgi:hypothetical protein